MSSAAHRLAALLATALVAVTAAATTTPGQAEAAPGSDRFLAGVPYDGEFASPTVLRANGRWYAYATNTDGNNLPVESSTDLRTWYPRDPLPDYWRWSGWAGYHDAMPEPASWAARRKDGGVWRYGIWAPAVARMGDRYVAAYAAMVDFKAQRLCISLARSATPDGVFTDRTKKPVVCSKDPHGSIDPHLLRAGRRNWLVWKNAGVPGSDPTRVWVRRLNDKATGFASGTRPHLLLTTAQRWEGNVIEAPAMIRFKKRFYLFYSGNTYTEKAYATGYAICRSVTGPCSRPRTTPLLASNDRLLAPGGAAPFVDGSGRLRLAYHAWDAGHFGYTTNPSSCLGTSYGCNQRKMHLAVLKVGAGGRLKVVSRG